MKEKEKAKPKCSLCGRPYEGFGNNAQPINNGRCCDTCNTIHVIPRRMALEARNSSKYW